jgi:hypothetical protein
MAELDDLIKFENESTSVDFKAKQYAKTEDLLKDLIAMANANITGDRHIIVGTKHLPDGSRKIWGIIKSEFVDSATYHQLARENIEPEIHFDYSPYEFEGHLLGVLRIYNCNDQPYMMRKDYVSLRAGDAWIRKGSHQPRLIRADLNRIWEKRRDEFTANIKIGFDSAGLPKEIAHPAMGEVQLPSDQAATRIREVLAEREKKLPPGDASLIRHFIESGTFPKIGLGPTPYSQRSSKELRENLEKVKDTYREDDLHALYEQHASRINLSVLNEGDTYIEDASIEIRIPKVKGLRVAAKIYTEPDRSGPFAVPRVSLYGLGRHYPSVKNYREHIRVFESVGTLRHGIPERTFHEPLRMIFGKELVGQKVLLECTLYGKQLRTPRKETLTIEVTEASQSLPGKNGGG